MYKYKCTLRGHTADVRGLSSIPHLKNKAFLSCSRDKTACLWSLSPSDDFEESVRFTGHATFVSCICVMAPVPGVYPEGLIFTGSNDNQIRVFNPESPSPLHIVSGHNNTVCSLSTHNEFLLSGSWDKTAKVWLIDLTANDQAPHCVFTLNGHEAAVWDVLMMHSSEKIVTITASADKTIRIWDQDKCQTTLTGHADCVRKLAALHSLKQFLSCANDATIKQWSIDGKCIQTYYGHQSFIYSIAVAPGESQFATSSEDKTVRLWSINQASAMQVIPLPAQSLWSVSVLSNNDIVVGCSDATIRIFTQQEDYFAEGPELLAFEEELASSKIPSAASDNGLSGLDVSKLPGPEALEKPGGKDGQTLMVKRGSAVEAHQWSASELKWIKIGDVIGSQDENKTTFNGKEYDYVFKIDVEDGKPQLHLPYNKCEDPWLAAQKFIDEHNLSQLFLDQVANFIYDNTGGQKLGPDTPSGNAPDPFTGGGRYVPGSDAKDDGASISGQDPFTGRGRYVPGSGKSKEHVASNGNGDSFSKSHIDPMVAPSRYIPDSENVHSPSTKKARNTTNIYFPKEEYIYFENANVSAIIKKVQEFSTNTPNVITEENVAAITRLLLHSDKASVEDLQLLWSLLHWPLKYIFPILDIFRCYLSKAQTIDFFVSNDKFAELVKIFQSCLGSDAEMAESESEVISPKTMDMNRFLVLRCMSNMARLNEGLKVLVCKELLTNAVFHISKDSKNCQTSIATLLLNYSVMLFRNCVTDSINEVALLCVRAVLEQLQNSNCLAVEAVFRLLVALGTLLNENPVAVASAESLDYKAAIQMALLQYGNVEKIKNCAQIILDANTALL